MRSTLAAVALVISACALPLLTGCAATSSAPSAPDEIATREINRTQAIVVARTDASQRFRELMVADISARRQGGYWVVELKTPTGSGLRYAIANDGAIRATNTFQ